MPHAHTASHQGLTPGAIPIGIVTISDTRTPGTDAGGDLAETLCRAAGYAAIERRLVRDEPEAIAGAIRDLCDAGTIGAILTTGGTGISGRDRTVEAITPLLDRPLPGFGELFRALSFAEVGSAAMLSRAMAGVRGTVPIFVMPGSPKGVRLALERLILPELPHVVAEARRST